MNTEALNPIKIVVAVALAVVLTIVLSLGGCAGIKSFNRTQKRADANNRVKITAIYVRQQQQEARRIAARDGVVRAQADQRVIAARGIAESQRLIAKTLTPLYVQFEAIQTQAASHAAERIYIPVGAQGVPLVANVGSDSLNAPGK